MDVLGFGVLLRKGIGELMGKDNRVPRRPGNSMRQSSEHKTTVVSKPGAVLRVERIDLSDAQRQSLTANVDRIGKPLPPKKPD